MGAVHACVHEMPSSETSIRGPRVPVSFEKLKARPGVVNDASDTHLVIAAEYGKPCEKRIAMSPLPVQPRLEVRNGGVPSQRSNTAGNFVQIEPPENSVPKSIASVVAHAPPPPPSPHAPHPNCVTSVTHCASHSVAQQYGSWAHTHDWTAASTQPALPATQHECPLVLQQPTRRITKSSIVMALVFAP